MGEILPQCCFSEKGRKVKERVIQRRRRGKKKSWRLAWVVGEDELAPLGSAWSLFLFEGSCNLLLLIVDLGRFSKMTKHFCHLPQLLCDRRFFPFRGQCLGCGEGGTTRPGLPLAWCWPLSCGVWFPYILNGYLSVWFLLVTPCQERRAPLKGRNAQRPRSVSLGRREADLVTSGEAPGLVRTW